MSHAGYLGVELAKAETALKLSLKYTQDQPLRT
jgi:tetrahydromethanopterin S-methyltransferase subunit A